MTRLPGPLRVLMAVAATFFLLPSPAQAAYIDPGTGSYILQLVAGAVLAGLITVRGFWTQIRALVKRPEADRESSGE